MKNQAFMDTAFLIALIDRSDKYHNIAVECYRKLIQENWSVVVTEAILIEMGNGLSELKWRQTAWQWITGIQKSKSIFEVVPVTTEIVRKAIELYGSRLDKEWGLTDCISFIIMKERSLNFALTVDHHFEQAGFAIFMDISK